MSGLGEEISGHTVPSSLAPDGELPLPPPPVPFGSKWKNYDLHQSLHHLPKPKSPSKCQLLCCFYAEFDDKVGPKICFESPRGFMDKDVSTPAVELETMLLTTFRRSTPGTTPITSCRKTSKNFDKSSEETTDESSRDTSPSVELPDKATESASIFDSCSEYIIPGSDELTGNIISLSTHQFHVLTRPTLIHNEKYARNALLFSVGFVLRRTEDPRPFRPVLSKIALTLQDMEMDVEYLTRNRSEIQFLMDGLLVTLNGNECNLLLGQADCLNLKLFRPPRAAAPPVKDYEVPILLRYDWQQTCDWDLAIIWVSRHIDGISNAKQISIAAEVDMEMVRACLRVLRHHKVIAVVDMFFYTNHYECTDKCLRLFKNSPTKESTLLNEAVAFVVRRQALAAKEPAQSADYRSDSSPELNNASSPSGQSRRFQPARPRAPSDLSRDASIPTPRTVGTMNSSVHEAMLTALSSLQPDLLIALKTAISEFFFSCHRAETFGDVWINLMKSAKQSFDWKKVFKLLDHRRLATFGVVNGLISRVHSYPLLLTRPSKLGQIIKLPTFSSKRPQRPSSPHHSKHRRKEEARLKKGSAARLMDGEHCDDEIACTVGLCISELVALFEANNVILVYADSSDS